MASRLSPQAAREILEETRRRADQERRANARAQRRAAWSIATEAAGWADQTNLMIKAAVAGKTVVTLDKPVVRREQLLSADLLVTAPDEANPKPTLIQWGTAEPKTPWDDFTLPSLGSLSWLAGPPGQTFFSWLEVNIKCAARVKQDQFTFRVNHSNALRSHITDLPDEILVCPNMPSMLHVLSVLGWSSTGKALEDETYQIALSW